MANNEVSNKKSRYTNNLAMIIMTYVNNLIIEEKNNLLVMVRNLEVLVENGNANLVTLTKKEKEVVDLVATGYTNKEIAKQMFLTEGTVKSYIHNVLTKFGLKNRYEIIIRFKDFDRNLE
jgi:DNA-binding NarL/FixJ family response regulator